MNFIMLLEILNIPNNARLDTDLIKSAYRKLAKKYHPDLFNTVEGKAKATKIFKEVTEAYEYLLVHYKEYNQTRDKRSHKHSTNTSVATTSKDRNNVDKAKEKKHFIEFDTLYGTVFQDFMI